MELLLIFYIHLGIFWAAAGLLLLAGSTQLLARMANLRALHSCAFWLLKGAQAITLLLAACVIGTSLTFLVGFFRSVLG